MFEKKSFFGWTLSRISFVNWSGFIINDIDLSHENALITAPNGTGKTALFDGMAVCVGGGESFDVRASNSLSYLNGRSKKNGRTPLAYILGTYQGGIMRETAVGFIGLTYENRAKGKKVSIIVRMTGRHGDEKLSEQNSMIVVGSDVSTKDFVNDENVPFDWDVFRDYMKAKINKINESDIKTFSSSNKNDFRKTFFNLITPKGTNITYRRYQKLLNMMKQGVASNEELKGGSFIRNHIIDTGEDTKIDLGESKNIIFKYKEQIKYKSAFHDFCTSVFAFMEMFEEKNNLNEELEIKTKEMLHTKNTNILKNMFHIESVHSETIKQKQQVDEIISKNEEEQKRLFEKNVELKNCEIARIINEQKTKLKEINNSILYKEKDFSNASDKISNDTSILNLIGLDYKDTSQEQLDLKISELENNFGNSQLELNQKTEELKDVRNNIQELKNGQRVSYPILKDAEIIHRQYIENGIKATPLYKLVDNIDEKYSLAIESFLGNRRFAMIPETMDDYYKAKNILSHDHIIIVHPEVSGVAEQYSLANYIDTSNPKAKSFLNNTLGKLFPSNEDGSDTIGDNTIGLVANKYNKLSRFSRFYNHNIHCVRRDQFVFGKRTLEQTNQIIIDLTEKMNQLLKDISHLKTQISNNNTLRKKLENIVLGSSIEQIESELKRLKIKQNEVEKEITELQNNNDIFEEINKNEKYIFELENLIKENRNKNEKIISEIGKMEERIENLRLEFSNSSVVEYEKINNDDNIIKVPNKDFEKSYYKKYQKYNVTDNDIKKINDDIKQNAERTRKHKNKMISDNNQSYRQFPNLYEECDRIIRASDDSDESFKKITTSFLQNNGVQNLDELDSISESIQQALYNINNILKTRYFKSAYNIIENVRKSMRSLNGALKNIVMHNATYSFEYTPLNEMKTNVQLIDYAIKNSELFSTEDWEDDIKEKYEKLISKIAECDNNDILLDPISWFNFEIKVTVNNKKMPLEAWLKTGSGGMRKVPGYVALLGAIKSSTTLTKNEAGPVVLFIDEAMEQIDTKTSVSIIDMFKEAGIQVIYLTNSSNFPKTAVSQIISMRTNSDMSVVIDNPIYVGEPVKEETRKSISRFHKESENVNMDMFND